MKNLLLLSLLFLLALAGCESTPPPAPPLPGGAQDQMGARGGSTGPHRVTILPLRNGQ